MSENDKKILRDDFLKQGAELIQGELNEQSDFTIGLQQDIELKNIDLLSTNILVNKNLNSTIKNSVKEYSENIYKILLATAHFIEKEQFKTVDEAINELSLSKFDKTRLVNLVDSQKNLSFSYGTLSVVIEIFKISNNNILNEISKVGSVDTIEGRLNKTNLYLKNSIIVYELTNFVVAYLLDFKLNGLDEILTIKNEVFHDLKKSNEDDEKLRKQAMKGNEQLKEMIISEINDRNNVREKIKEKWNIMISQIEGQKDTIKKAKGFVGDLTIVRDNARNRIDILNIAATTTLVENSINMISELSNNIQDWTLPPLDEKTACELLGLEI